MMKPTLVFDWNGTLLDDADALLQTTNVILNRFGFASIDLQKFREQCDLPFAVLYRKLGMSADEVEAADSNGSALFHDTYEPLASRAPLREGARDILEAAHRQGVQTLVLSNHIVEPIRVQLRRLGIEDYISEVLAFENRATQYKSMGKGERLRLYMQMNHLKPETTVIVGDMPVETEIARDLGLTSISITGGFVSEPRLQAAQPDYVIHNHHELQPILKKHGIFLN
jgi:phosphoglycolate phosphatase